MRLRSSNVVMAGLGWNLSRRAALRRIVAGVGGVTLGSKKIHQSSAQEASPEPAECVATAPPAQDGIGVVDLLLDGLVPDMPRGAVRVSISRFTLEPGMVVEAFPAEYPAFMYIETGESMCPGGPGRIVYNPDGSVLDVSTGEGFQRVPMGTTQYIPAGAMDGASNQGSTLMSSLVIVFAPAEEGATPTAATPSS